MQHILLCGPAATTVTAPFPTDPNATPAARALWNYLDGLKSRTTNKVLSGQRWLDYNTRIAAATGKWCALLNLAGSNIDRGTWAGYLNDTTAQRIQMTDWWTAGGIPLWEISLRDPVSQGVLGAGAVPIITAAQADLILTEGHAYNTNLKFMLNRQISLLLALQAAGVAVLGRMFHEHNGSGFWFLDNPRLPQLFRYCRQHIIDAGVHNVLWTHNVSDWAGSGTQGPPSDPNQYLQFYAGDDVTDILSFDVYEDGADFSAGAFGAYDHFVSAGKRQPIIFWEAGVKKAYTDTTRVDLRKIIRGIRDHGPNIVGWSCWSVTWSMDPAYNNNVAELLADPWVITRDEVPSFS